MQQNNNNNNNGKRAKSTAASLSKGEKREVKQMVDSKLAKQPFSQQPIKIPKNLKTEHKSDTSLSKLKDNLRFVRDGIKPENTLSPDALRYVKLLDKPFTAQWGDAGELPVKPLLYDNSASPPPTRVIRCGGSYNWSVPAGSAAWICLGGVQNKLAVAPLNADQDLFIPYAMYNSVRVNATPTYYNVTFGAPYDGRSTTSVGAGSGGGVAGFIYNTTDTEFAPVVNLADTVVINETTGGRILRWDNLETTGDMPPDDPSAYTFRPVACAVRIVPVDTAQNVGGTIQAMLIPESSNEQYVNGGDGVLGTGGAVVIENMSDHIIKRGTNIFESRWLPSDPDYKFHIASNGNASYATNAEKCVQNGRHWIKVTPPASTANSYMVQYVTFFELKGTTIGQSGTIARPNPQLGAKVSSAVQNVMHNDLNKELRVNQISDMSTLEVAKDHPTIGPMIEEKSTLKGAKGVFDNIGSVISTIGSVAAPLLTLL